MCASSQSNQPVPREYFVPVKNAELFVREIGRGWPIIIIHGGPDFDHNYLLPDMDRLADSYRLIYYDQRGLGKSRGDFKLEDINIEQYIEDLEVLRNHLGLESAAILGHSWGGHVAMHYAIRHPEGISHMVLMNTAPASYEDMLLIRQERGARMSEVGEKLNEIASSPEFEAGDPQTVAEGYRLLFSTTIKRPEDLDRLDLTWTRETILKGRAIEDHLMKGLYWSEGFTIIPQLKQLHVPTLVVHGDYDFIPVPCAEHIAEAIHSAHLVVIPDCGHFSYLEAPEAVRKAVDDFFAGG